MNKQTKIVSALLVIILKRIHDFHSQCSVFLEGLNERLEQFETCNIRIRAVFGSIEFESFTVPVVLLDAEKKIEPTWEKLFKITAIGMYPHLFAFKYRKIICSVSVNLLLYPRKELYDWVMKLSDAWFQRKLDYMNDKYLVIVRSETEFLVDNHQYVGNILQHLVDHKIFAWTVAFKNLQRLSFNKTS